jgi:hypothetical protein
LAPSHTPRTDAWWVEYMTLRPLSPEIALPRVLADLMAGLGAEEAALYRTAPGGAPVVVGLAGRAVPPPATLPALEDGGMAQLAGAQGHLALAAAAVPGGSLTLAVRRVGTFAEAELRLIRAALRALALSHH